MKVVKAHNPNKLMEKIFNRTKIYEIDDEIDLSKEKIGIRLSEPVNVLNAATNDEAVFVLLKKIIKNNYVIYWYHKNITYCIKISEIGKIWKRNDLFVENNVLFTVNEPANEMVNEKISNNLIVVFNDISYEKKDLLSTKIFNRTYPKYFNNIQNYAVPNTYVLRIADNRSLYGSFYMNTAEYPDTETTIQKIIQEVMVEYNIPTEQVVLLGENSGAVAAAYHAHLGDFKGVFVRPTIEHKLENFEINSDLNRLGEFIPKIDVGDVFSGFKKNDNKVTLFSEKNVLVDYSGQNIDLSGMAVNDMQEKKFVSTFTNILLLSNFMTNECEKNG